MTRLATLELHKEGIHFSAGHFTIFSATERENLHGHNYYVNVVFQVLLHDNGMAFDYRIYKNKIIQLCELIDRRFILPSQSKFLKIEEQNEIIMAHFNNEKIPFLKRDVVILPITNSTIEELSQWFLQQMTEDTEELKKHFIEAMTVRVFNGPEQSGAASWNKTSS